MGLREINKIKGCIFIHYSETASLPYYAELYIRELSRHFDSVTVLSNNQALNRLDTNLPENINFEYFENQGYDFGMFYRYIVNENMEKYSQLAIVNDSNFLIRKLDVIFNWGNHQDFDFWGAVDSIENPHFSTHENNYHIQSHFIVLNSKALELLPVFLDNLNLDRIFGETDIKALRHNVINDWEIGLSQFYIQHKLKMGAFIESEKMLKKYKPKKVNVTFSLFEEIIANEAYPLLKRKVATMKKKWYSLNKPQWRETILKYGEKDWNLEKL